MACDDTAGIPGLSAATLVAGLGRSSRLPAATEACDVWRRPAGLPRSGLLGCTRDARSRCGYTRLESCVLMVAPQETP
jgi:hypothetical protein